MGKITNLPYRVLCESFLLLDPRIIVRRAVIFLSLGRLCGVLIRCLVKLRELTILVLTNCDRPTFLKHTTDFIDRVLARFLWNLMTNGSPRIQEIL
jgi:hypothetical protein